MLLPLWASSILGVMSEKNGASDPGSAAVASTPAPTARTPFIRRVRIRNYKSIGKCDVVLRDLTVLVGRNGAGKSNFLDALRFVTDGLQTSLDHAMKFRGGIDSVRRRSTGHPRNFAVDLDIALEDSRHATYGFEIAARPKGGFAVKRERLRIDSASGQPIASYTAVEGEVVEFSEGAAPPSTRDRLYLVTAAGLPAYREVYDGLVAMGFYNLNPDAMKELQSPDAGELLHRDGGNIASVISRLRSDRPEIMNRISQYLTHIVPTIVDVDRVSLGPRETLEFRQEVKGASHPWRFYAVSVSDGTLRALGILAAVMQLAGRETPVRFVGVEEPEAALHPAVERGVEAIGVDTDFREERPGVFPKGRRTGVDLLGPAIADEKPIAVPELVALGVTPKSSWLSRMRILTPVPTALRNWNAAARPLRPAPTTTRS